MRSCIMTVVNDAFLFGAIAMFRSFAAHNPWFAGDLVALTNAENSVLSAAARARLAEDVPGIRIVDVPSEPFSRVLAFAETVDQTPPRLRASLFILEAFRTADYDRVVTLDSDMLILGDLRPLFELPAPVAVARAVNWITGDPLPYVNTGTMAIRRDHPRALTLAQIEATLDVEEVDPSLGKGDQAILNLVFRRHPPWVLDERWNFSKRRIGAEVTDVPALLAAQDIRVLHFLGQKPWAAKTRWSETAFGAAEELWTEAFLAAAGPATLRAFLAERRRREELMLGFVAAPEATPESRRRENALTRFVEERLYGTPTPEPAAAAA